MQSTDVKCTARDLGYFLSALIRLIFIQSIHVNSIFELESIGVNCSAPDLQFFSCQLSIALLSLQLSFHMSLINALNRVALILA